MRRYYAAGMPAPDTPVAEVSLLALDFETTGLDPVKHGIVSIGLVPFSLSRIVFREARQWLVKPKQSLTARSVTIHNITHQELEQAPDLLAVLDELLGVMQGRVIVAHYGRIERDFLSAALQERIGEGIEMPLIDTMMLEAAVHRSRAPRWWDRLRGRQPESIRLAQSRTRYNLPHYRPHHAVTDALACAELLQAQLAYRYSPETPVGDIWC